MGKVLEFRKIQPSDEVVIPELLRDYEQCRIQQEHAFGMRKYFEIMIVDQDYKRCFVRKSTKERAAYQIMMRNGGVMPPQFG